MGTREGHTARTARARAHTGSDSGVMGGMGRKRTKEARSSSSLLLWTHIMQQWRIDERRCPGKCSAVPSLISICVSGWQFNRIFRPPNRPPKDGRRPKDERLRVGDELGNDLSHDLGGQKILLNCHPVFQFAQNVKHSEKCTISSQFVFQSSILRCSKMGFK